MRLLQLLPVVGLLVGQGFGQNQPPGSVHFNCNDPPGGFSYQNCAAEDAYWCDNYWCSSNCRSNRVAFGYSAGANGPGQVLRLFLYSDMSEGEQPKIAGELLPAERRNVVKLLALVIDMVIALS
ncbi:hypothetical protein WAI453_012679 [Rhynchosporium graminicola]